MFSQSQAFRIFFEMFVGIIGVATLHGLLLTPAIMGEMPFFYVGINHVNDTVKSANKQDSNQLTVDQLTIQHSRGDSNANENLGGDSLQKQASMRDLNATGILDNIGPRTPVESQPKRSSVQMASFNGNLWHNDSSDDQFQD